MNISIYGSLYNYKKCLFDIDDLLDNFCNFADEVCLATIEDEDNTYDLLNSKNKKYSNLKVILSKAKPFTPRFDGQVKNDALQACSGDILFQLDADERINLGYKERLLDISHFFIFEAGYDAIMFPVINLYKDLNHFKDINSKWYVHKPGLKRGVIKQAQREDGTHDIKISDSCELLLPNDELCSFRDIIGMNGKFKDQEKLEFIKEKKFPFVWHLGYLDLGRRILINREHWQNQWSAEEGKEVKIPLTVEELKSDCFEHGLELW